MSIHSVSIIGASGMVGQELLFLMSKYGFHIDRLRLFGSSQSVGTVCSFNGKDLKIEGMNQSMFEGVDLAFFCTPADVSRAYVPLALAAGTKVIDKSSYFRMDTGVPLIIPEVNGYSLKKDKNLISSPNCTTILALMALGPLHHRFGLKSFWACTYQAVSGSGKKGIDELLSQLNGSMTDPEVYAYPIAFNVIPQVDTFLDNGYTQEEVKIVKESQKILDLPLLKGSVTCVRVPVMRSHSISISAQFEQKIDISQVYAALEEAKGIQVMDDPAKLVYPFPLLASRKKDCLIGRIRMDTGVENGLSFFVCGDQLWKGAALNALQIAVYQQWLKGDNCLLIGDC